MNSNLLHKKVQEYIFEKSNTTIDLSKLILSKSPFENISSKELAQQISGRLKVKQKLPTWHTQSGIYYPPNLNLEQTSSEVTALYKSKLISGETLIDLTGGFGIDDYFFSKTCNKVIHCELNSELSEIASHNFKILKSNNITPVFGDSIDILKKLEQTDWIYIDPSRRHDHKGKVFFLEDCLPNVPANLDLFFTKSTSILIKTSPLLDLRAGINSLQHVKEIHIVAVQNEVKELLWVLDKNFNGDIIIKTINIRKKGNQEFSFLLKDESNVSVSYSLPKKYLYEPNAAILKSGGFLSVANKLNVDKLHLHSHLYTSDQKFDFPGRNFEILSVYAYQKKIISKIGIKKANITTRNFPESVTSLRKKYKIKDGGEDYLFFTTNNEQKKIVIHCRKLLS
ncbi:SAM-dependent methyltransferase [Aquimarina sp. AU474]|uniref:THUMP-like domain-containing protein n=1 Tax=Aquimarina sp. AU474 TaxID=2108529 RepID=UPI000D68CFF6|nr:SAM-dependent methyltransferase [Aquimarina sp. AU474]